MTSLRNLALACAISVGVVGCTPERSARPTPQRSAAASEGLGRGAFPTVAAGETVLRRPDGTLEATYRYRLVLPRADAIADPGAVVPLIVFLHGSGERGADNEAQLKHFAGWCAGDEMQTAHPCYVLAMQCPSDETWAALDLKAYRESGAVPRQSAEPTRAMRALMQAIDEVAAARAVDASRIYLTGLSMGGFGAFDLAARRPAMFAAVVPICGGGDPNTAGLLARTPFCIVHGADDPVVPVGLSRIMRDAIAKASTEASTEGVTTKIAGELARERESNPMYVEYAKVGHDAWTPAYRLGPEGVVDWMFVWRGVGVEN